MAAHAVARLGGGGSAKQWPEKSRPPPCSSGCTEPPSTGSSTANTAGSVPDRLLDDKLVHEQKPNSSSTTVPYTAVNMKGPPTTLEPTNQHRNDDRDDEYENTHLRPCSEAMLAMKSGTVPSKLLDDRSTNWTCEKAVNSAGSWPVKLVLLRFSD